MSNEASDVSNEALDVSNEALDVSNEALDVSNEALDVSNEALDMSNEALDMSNETLDMSNEASDVSNEAFRRTGDRLGGTKKGVAVATPQVNRWLLVLIGRRRRIRHVRLLRRVRLRRRQLAATEWLDVELGQLLRPPAVLLLHSRPQEGRELPPLVDQLLLLLGGLLFGCRHGGLLGEEVLQVIDDRHELQPRCLQMREVRRVGNQRRDQPSQVVSGLCVRRLRSPLLRLLWVVPSDFP